MSQTMIDIKERSARDVSKFIQRRVFVDYFLPDIQPEEGKEYPAFTMCEDIADVYSIIDGAKAIFKDESALIHTDGPVKVFGDLHGQFIDLMQFFYLFGNPDNIRGDIAYVKYLFLGDMIDRGYYSLETVLFLFSLKILFPDRVILLRGNHESRIMNRKYGFYEELTSKLGFARGEEIWKMFNDAFDDMPISCVISNKILCMHGMVGPNVKSLSDIEEIKLPLVSSVIADEDETWTNLVARDLLWSDPAVNSCGVGFIENKQRGDGTFRVGDDEMEKFFAKTGIELVLRAHECVPLGYSFNTKGRVLTVFSAINYVGDSGNNGAMILVTDKLVVTPKIIQHTYDAARVKQVVTDRSRLRESSMGLDSEEDDVSDEVIGVCVFDFVKKEGTKEISLKQGDVVQIIDTSDLEWAWVMTVDDEEGFVPKTFLKY